MDKLGVSQMLHGCGLLRLFAFIEGKWNGQMCFMHVGGGVLGMEKEKDIGILERRADDVLHGLDKLAEYNLCRGG